jgi:hypothetical protein
VDVVDEEQRGLARQDGEDRLDDARRRGGVRSTQRRLAGNERPHDVCGRVTRTIDAFGERRKERQIGHRPAALDRGPAQNPQAERHRKARRLTKESRLADSGLADDEHEARLPRRGRLERGREQLDLGLPANERLRRRYHQHNDKATFAAPDRAFARRARSRRRLTLERSVTR